MQIKNETGFYEKNSGTNCFIELWVVFETKSRGETIRYQELIDSISYNDFKIDNMLILEWREKALMKLEKEIGDKIDKFYEEVWGYEE